MPATHLATLVSVAVMAAFLNSVTDCFRTCRVNFVTCSGHICEEAIRKFLELLGVRRDSYDETDNLEVVPRVMKELGLFTRDSKFKWDANAQRDDGLQYGWHRLPSKSVLLRYCAYFEITHYIHFPYHGKHIELVAPVEACKLLIDLSNQRSTRKLTRAQKEELEKAFGMGDYLSGADTICLRYEKMIVFMVCLLCLGVGGVIFRSFPARVFLSVLSLLIVLFYSWFATPCQTPTDTIPDTNVENVLEAGLLRNATVVDDPITEQVEIQPYVEPVAATDNRQRVFYLAYCDNKHWHAGMPKPLPLADKRPVFKFREAPQAYAVPSTQCFATSIAKRVEFDHSDALHMTFYNPMTDPYLFSAHTVFNKGVAQRNLFLVIFPSIFDMEEVFDQQWRYRIVLQDDARFISTRLDLRSLLYSMTTGVAFFPELIFVLPVPSVRRNLNGIIHTDVWTIFLDVLQPENCHEVPESWQDIDEVILG